MTLAIALSSVLCALVLVIALVLPSVNSPTVPFGVRVPAPHATEPMIARQTRVYRWRVLVSGIVVAGIGVLIYSVTREPLLLPLSVLAVVGVWNGCFIMANHEIRAAKAAGGWYEGLRQGIAVDTELRTDPPRFPWLWLAPALIIIVVTVVIGVLSYSSMPALLAMHYVRGVPTRLAAKSVGNAFSLVFVQIGVTAVFGGMAAAVIRSSRSDLDPAHPVSSAHWHRQYLVLGARALLGLVAMIDLGLLGFSLLTWTGTVTAWAPAVIVVPILAGVAVALTVLARHNRVRVENDEDTGVAHRDDDKYWRGGLFYVNRDDPALFVPRRFGIGWTLNFGNPRTAILAAGIVVVIGLAVTLRFVG
ncbi:MAG TPA: DUF5808 domain-containing protein [Pseudonocardiaceae bacterium]|jgi:uncharacterized membrane protein|nr:DUF5808 domain-containing protein [Pseudonocardiaceae bacterium]